MPLPRARGAMEEVAPEEFAGDRLRRPGRFVVAFSASWCPFCRDFLRRVVPRESSLGAPLLLADLSDEENPLWDRFHIDVVPTLVAFVDGAVAWRIDGLPGAGIRDRELERVPRLWSGAPEL